jgi:hypothetical protein
MYICACYNVTSILQEVQQLSSVKNTTKLGWHAYDVKSPLQLLWGQAKGWAMVHVHCTNTTSTLSLTSDKNFINNIVQLPALARPPSLTYV